LAAPAGKVVAVRIAGIFVLSCHRASPHRAITSTRLWSLSARCGGAHFFSSAWDYRSTAERESPNKRHRRRLAARADLRALRRYRPPVRDGTARFALPWPLSEQGLSAAISASSSSLRVNLNQIGEMLRPELVPRYPAGDAAA
jgi:hypothetical protein